MKKTNKVIMKFGGTSVGSPDAIRQLVTIVSSSKKPVAGVVVSAFSKITNQLVESAQLASKGNKDYSKFFLEIADRHRKVVNELIIGEKVRKVTLEHVEIMLSELESILHGVFLIKELSPKILDTVMSYGERLSAYIISQVFAFKGIRAEFVDARSLITTDASFGSARVDFDQTYSNISNYYRTSKKSLKVISGFIGSTVNGETTTLGRGGSDYTASIFGAALCVSNIIIWTDVDGVLTADPRKVPQAFTIPQMTYQEAMEMSHFGAKVIYHPTMIPALTHKIPMAIRNTFNPSYEGTVISENITNGHMIKGISSIEAIALLLVQGSGLRRMPEVAARLFNALAVQDINIILITQASSEYTICFAIDSKDTLLAKSVIEDEFKYEIRDGFIDELVIEEDLSIIAVIGEQLRKRVGNAGKIFMTLGDAKINISIIAHGSSERNISFVIARKDESKAIEALHKTFFEK